MTPAQQLVTDNIAVWASAIRRRSTAGRGTSKKLELYGVQKLRELILELAVRGLLVQQDPTDEPASALLTKIATEKAKLIKAGKIKKDRQLPVIGEGEMPLKPPGGWVWVRNADLFSLRKGRVPQDLSDTGQIPYLDIEALDRGNVRRYTNDPTTPQSTVSDLLVVCDGSRSGLVLDGISGAIGSTLSVIDTSQILQPFIKLLFNHGFERLNSSLKGAAIPHLDTKTLLNEIVGLPPLAEQQRIIAKVGELMALCSQLEQQTEISLASHLTLVETLLATLLNAVGHEQFGSAWQRIAAHFDTLFTTDQSINQLKQTILQLAVMGKLVPQDPGDEPAGELLKRIAAERAKFVKESKTNKDSLLPQIEDKEAPFTLPTGWQWARLGTIASLRGGFAYQSSHFVSTGEHQVIRMGNVRPDFLRLEENPVYISKQNADSTKDYEILDGDILLTMTGTKGKNDYLYSVLVNKANIDSRRLYLNQRLCSIRLPLFSRDFANVALKDSRLLNAIYKTSTGSANQANVGMGAISSWLIPVPPIDEQHRIVAKVGELMALCNQLNARLNEAQTTQVHLADAMTEQALAV